MKKTIIIGVLILSLFLVGCKEDCSKYGSCISKEGLEYIERTGYYPVGDITTEPGIEVCNDTGCFYGNGTEAETTLGIGDSFYDISEESIKEVECTIDGDCGYSRIPQACIDYTCEYVDCVSDYDCDLIFGDSLTCINNECISHVGDCERVAKIDYNHKNPSCKYIFGKCYCDDYVIDSPEKRIEKDNSVQVIDEEGHFENYVIFGLKPEVDCTVIPLDANDEWITQCSDVMFYGNITSSITDVTAEYIIDCSLPEEDNYTVEIVFGEAIYNNTNTIEIPFTEFCKRLEEE